MKEQKVFPLCFSALRDFLIFETKKCKPLRFLAEMKRFASREDPLGIFGIVRHTDEMFFLKNTKFQKVF